MYETNVTNKDFRKGSKEAAKAIKKLDRVSKEAIQELMDKAANRTMNADYLSGYFDQCRQKQCAIA